MGQITCCVAGCTKPKRIYRGYCYSRFCTTHLSRRQRHRGTEAYAKHSGPQLNDKHAPYHCKSDGYARVTFYGVDVRLRTLIWMLTHGRPVPKGYHVHHKNFKKYPNTPSNLQLLPEGKHHALHKQNLP